MIPKMPAPDLIRGGYRFRKRSCSNDNLERDDDAKLKSARSRAARVATLERRVAHGCSRNPGLSSVAHAAGLSSLRDRGHEQPVCARAGDRPVLRLRLRSRVRVLQQAERKYLRLARPV